MEFNCTKFKMRKYKDVPTLRETRWNILIKLVARRWVDLNDLYDFFDSDFSIIGSEFENN